jgi:hypothetical protein
MTMKQIMIAGVLGVSAVGFAMHRLVRGQAISRAFFLPSQIAARPPEAPSRAMAPKRTAKRSIKTRTVHSSPAIAETKVARAY